MTNITLTLRDIGKVLISFPAKAILIILGWSPPDKSVYKVLNRQKVIMPFPHTTYWDFFLFFIYMLAYPDEFQHFKAFVKPQAFDKWGWILEPMGFLKPSRLEDRGGGTIDRIVKSLEGYSRFYVLISPKGTVKKAEWRSGYKVLAERLGADIIPAGLDYRSRELKATGVIGNEYIMAEFDVEERCKKQFGEIVPLYEHRATTKTHADSQAFSVNWYNFFNFIFILEVLAITINISHHIEGINNLYYAIITFVYSFRIIYICTTFRRRLKPIADLYYWYLFQAVVLSGFTTGGCYEQKCFVKIISFCAMGIMQTKCYKILMEINVHGDNGHRYRSVFFIVVCFALRCIILI